MQVMDAVTHKVVSAAEWTEAHKAFLAKEKELTRQRDELGRQRRELPWVKVDKNYVFDGPGGKQTLPDLFDGRSQLIGLPLHVRSGMGGRVPKLLHVGRTHGCEPGTPDPARRDAGGRFPCVAEQDT